MSAYTKLPVMSNVPNSNHYHIHNYFLILICPNSSVLNQPHLRGPIETCGSFSNGLLSDGRRGQSQAIWIQLLWRFLLFHKSRLRWLPCSKSVGDKKCFGIYFKYFSNVKPDKANRQTPHFINRNDSYIKAIHYNQLLNVLSGFTWDYNMNR